MTASIANFVNNDAYSRQEREESITYFMNAIEFKAMKLNQWVGCRYDTWFLTNFPKELKESLKK